MSLLLRCINFRSDNWTATPSDVDSLVNQLKEAAKKAGLPADQAEAWLKHKAQDGQIDAESLVS